MIHSHNEWSQLHRIVVGTATNAHWPVHDIKFRTLEQTTKWFETPVPKGNVSQNIIDETNEDLENLVNALTSLNVIVERPTDLDFEAFDGMYNYCPRDRVLIIGDAVIDAPMLYPIRTKEIEALQHVLPKNIIHCDNPNAVFDAANVCRLGNNILYLVSDSGNRIGAEWLQQQLGDRYNVCILDNIYSGVHIDSTIVPVREGLVVVNGDRINNNNMPAVFKDWDVISITGNDIVEQSFINYPYASKYIALNFLSVNTNTVICDPHQYVLRKELEKRNVSTIGIELRHSRTLGGGHHCVTLDLERY